MPASHAWFGTHRCQKRALELLGLELRVLGIVPGLAEQPMLVTTEPSPQFPP